MDMKDLKQFITNKAPKKKLTEAPQYDGQVNAVVWHGRTVGEATVMVHQKHDKGQHGVDQAVFALLKQKLGPKLRALTKLKIDNTPVRTKEGNYHLVTVEFKTQDAF